MKTVLRKGSLQQQLIYIRSSLWFVPALIILGAIALAMGMIELDRHIDDDLRQRWPRIFLTEAEGARSMLTAIAGSMATVAGVAFSITVVALALASSQYTSRVLRNFMRDPANQVVLGVLVGVYVYCLIVLRTLSGGNGVFIPNAAVLVALGLTLFATGAFIYFIHHISTSIQASDMVAAITCETLDAIDVLFPAYIGEEPKEPCQPNIPGGITWHAVPALKMGYVQSVDTEELLGFARHHHTIVRMECGIGDFIAPGEPLASLALPAAPGTNMIRDFNRIYAIDSYRTIDQDAAFGIRQLVDMSLKALSPGINDTTTAVTCIEHLAVLLKRCARRRIAAPHRMDGETLRVIAHGQNFSVLVALAFNQILENAEGNTEIMLRMLDAIEKIASATNDVSRINALERQVLSIAEASMRSVRASMAREELGERLQQVRIILAQKKPAP